MTKEGKQAGFFDPVIQFFERTFNRETILDVSLSPQASQYLKELLLRPNPRLGEFPFLGLGTPSSIDEIFIAQGAEFSRGLHAISPYIAQSSVAGEDHYSLLRAACDKGRIQDVVLYGHTHPSGRMQSGVITYDVIPTKGLLEPSTGNRYEGGIQRGGDLAFYRSVQEFFPEIEIRYVGIAANVEGGPMMKIYQTNELLKTKRLRDFDTVPQRVFCL